jgi:nicotinate-nucleotide adenylyltransferase
MERVGIFGGAFDPPHRAHTRIAQAALQQFGLDEIRWIPTGTPPHKEVLTAKAEDRLHMVRLATLDRPGMTVSEVEIKRKGASFTIDTLRLLNRSEPDTGFYLVIGSDSHVAFSTWKEPEAILELARLIVYPRHDDERSSSAAPCKHLKGAIMDVSSSDIRARIGAGLSARDMLDEEVLSYIERRRLYLPG